MTSTNGNDELRNIIVKHTSEMLDNPNEYEIYPTSKFYNDLIADIGSLLERRVKEARIDENQIRLDRINNFHPKPGQLTSASFGSAGAGMEIASLKRSLEDRIAELSQREGKRE